MNTHSARFCLTFLAIAAGFAGGASAADGDSLWLYDGAPIIEAFGAQRFFAVVGDGHGGIIAAWEDEGAGGIRVQRLDDQGNQVWTTGTGVPLAASGSSPALFGDGSGGATVAWDTTSGIYVQKVNASGVPQWTSGGVQVGTVGESPLVVTDGAGGAFVAWGEVARIAHVNSSGTVTAPGVNGITLGSSVRLPWMIEMISDGFGGAYVVWADFAKNIVAQRVDAGLPWGSQPTVISNDVRDEGPFSIASDGNGGLLVGWAATQLVPANAQVRVQRVDSLGISQWSANGEIVVDSAIVGGSTTAWTFFGIDPAVTSDGAGGAILAWSDWRNDPTGTGNDDIFAQRIDANGVPQWTTNGVLLASPFFTDGTSPGSQRGVRVVADGEGGAVVAFQDLGGHSYDITAIRLNEDGIRHWSTWAFWDSISAADPGDTQQWPELVYDASGPAPLGTIVAWVDSGSDLYAQKLELSVPANDACGDAINVGVGTYIGNLLNTSVDGDASCQSPAGNDAWYRFTATSTGMLRVNTCGTHDTGGVDTGIDTTISLHTACPGTSGNELGGSCNDDWPGGSDPTACGAFDAGATYDSAAQLPVSDGQTVLIRVSRHSASSDGPFSLTVGFTPAAQPNEYCSTATPIGLGQTVGTITGATNDGSASCATGNEPDVWYTYTAPASGTLSIDTCGTNDLGGVDTGLDTLVSVHTSCPGTAANEPAGGCNDDWISSSDPTACAADDAGALRDSSMDLNVTAGQTLYIRVSPFSAPASGNFVVNLGFAALEAGRIPADDSLGTRPLQLHRVGGNVELTWDASCDAGDVDFAVYEGPLGAFGLHAARTCGTGGALTWTLTPSLGSSYYLVVPVDAGGVEGSYGLDGQGLERGTSATACYPQAVGVCTP